MLLVPPVLLWRVSKGCDYEGGVSGKLYYGWEGTTMVAEFICRSSLKINGWCILALPGSIWRYLALHPQGEKLPLIACAQGSNEQVVRNNCLHIKHRVWGYKKTGYISSHLEGRIFSGGGKIGHHESQIASGVTDNQNTIRILIIF